jgi:hypothetical protein
MLRVYILFLLLLISHASYAKNNQIELNDIVIGTVGNHNQNKLAIGTTANLTDKKVTVRCKSIKQIIVGQNNRLDLMLANNAKSICQEKNQ